MDFCELRNAVSRMVYAIDNGIFQPGNRGGGRRFFVKIGGGEEVLIQQSGEEGLGGETHDNINLI